MGSITKKQVYEEIAQASALASVSEVFAEIASVRMRRVRKSVLSNRQFLSSINSVFQDVLAAYKSEIDSILKELVKTGKLTFLAHNGRTVVVLLSVNSSLYGEAVNESFELFIKEIKDRDVEVAILGRYGLTLYKQIEPNRPYTYFEFPDEGVEPTLMGKILRHLVQYKEIRLVYPLFESLTHQTAVVSVISSEAFLQEKTVKSDTKYIFDPDILSVMQFFESEIFASLFEQSIRESQLAKFASRMLAMDRASQKVQEYVKNLRLKQLRISHTSLNKKILQSLPSVMSFSNNQT